MWTCPGTDAERRPIPGEGTRLRPVSATPTTVPQVSLDGTWQFHFSPEIPDDGPTPSWVDAGWDAPDGYWRDMPVPAHWGLVATDVSRPQYTNVTYPFPVDPPFVPDANPTGDYLREFLLPATDGEGEWVLRVLGVESSARIWIDGEYVGLTQGSRLTQDLALPAGFDANPQVTHTIAVRVSQFSAGSYLEDQDQWWLPGIFRPIVLVWRPRTGVADVTVRADYHVTSGDGLLQVEALAGQAPSVSLDGRDLGVMEPVEGGDADDCADLGPGEWRRYRLSARVPQVTPWSPANPALATLSVATPAEERQVRVGFRTVTIEDGQLRVNGRRLVLRGVNRHEILRDQGRVFDREAARRDLALMKQHNVNAIRTSHYPPSAELLDLCDEMGLWVMDECDLETHGFECQGWRDNPTDEPAWRDAILDRTRRFIARDRNHACVVVWSLGNESGTGTNLAASADLIRRLDPSRPIHYEADYEGAYSDFHSRMYPALDEVDAFFEGDGPVAWAGHPCSRLTPAQCQHARTLPYVMIECLHAMGTGPGGIGELWRRVDAHPTHCGGFVWEWRDHALALAPGDERLGYGGDFGEKLHDGNFVCDGLISANEQVSPGLSAWAATVAPLRIMAAGPDAVRVSNGDAIDRSAPGVLRILDDAGALTLQLPGIDPEGAGTLRLPRSLSGRVTAWALELGALRGVESTPACGFVGDEAACGPAGSSWGDYRVASVAQWQAEGDSGVPGRGETAADEGGCVASAQVLSGALAGAPAAEPVPRVALAVDGREPEALTADAANGHVADFFAGLFVPQGTPRPWWPRPQVWRAPTDNDGGHGGLDYWDRDPASLMIPPVPGRAASSADRWREAHLDAATHSTRHVDATSWYAVTSAPLATWQLDTHASLSAADSRVDLRLRATPVGQWPAIIPRLGWAWTLPEGVLEWAWQGLGPGPSYPDMAEGAWMGTFAEPADRQAWLSHSPLKPQECSLRQHVTRFAVRTSAATWVFTASQPVGVSLVPYSVEALSTANHAWELAQQPPSGWQLIVDTHHHGIGSRSCGPDVLPAFQAHPTASDLTVSLRQWA